MSSTSSSLQNTERQGREQNVSSGKFHIFLCFGAAILLLFGIAEIYKTSGFIIGQYQVKSIDLVEDDDAFYPRWLVMITYRDQTKDGILLSTTGLGIERWAWKEAQKYKINQTYPCYRSQVQDSFNQWSWQWNKPSKWVAFGFLFGGISLCFISTLYMMCRGCCVVKPEITRQQQQQEEILLRSDERHQPLASPDTPPPPYKKVVQQSTER